MAGVLTSRSRPRGDTAEGSSRSDAASTRPAPWGADDLVRWLVLVGAGAVVVAVSWYLAAGDSSLNQQIGPTDAAIGGVVLAGLSNVGWLLRGRRAIGERRRRLLPEMAVPEQVRVIGRSTPSEEPLHAAVGTPEAIYLGGEGLERFHRHDCPLAVGRSEWMAATRQAHEQAGRRPCGMCRP